MSRRETNHLSALRAVAHPVRLQILSLLTGAELSAAEIARELNLTSANASYHLRVLAAAGEVVDAGEKRIRGGVAKRYRHPWDAQPPSVAEPSETDQKRYVEAMAQELVRRYELRRPTGSRLLADADMWVEPQVWEEVTALVVQASRLIHAEAKPPRTEGTVHVNLTAVLFSLDGSHVSEQVGKR